MTEYIRSRESHSPSSNDQCFDTRHSRQSLLDMLTIDIYSS